MKTDLPLKRLTRLCPDDLLPLLGTPPAEVVGVESLELPTTRTSLDTVLRLRDRDGHEHLHLVEWQGYNDQLLLWRTLGYLAWLGQNRPERPIRATVIYLTPDDDVGTTIMQAPDTAGGWAVTLSCVRLWEQDAAAALASAAPGLIVLSPLMRGATAEMAEQAALALLRTTEQPTQGELLTTLGVFAEPLLKTERFIRLVTRERLMSTDLISYLFQDKFAELEQKQELLEAKLDAQTRQMREILQQSVEDVIIARFPSVQALLTRRVREVEDFAKLQKLRKDMLVAADLDEVERLLEAASRG